MNVRVKCTYYLDVEVPDGPDYDAEFDLVENHCPGTGRVGRAFEKSRKEADAYGICWACRLGGQSEIVRE